MTSPTQRSLAYLRKLGYTAQVVEHWNHFANVRQDLFGFIDIVAIQHSSQGCLGIQTTTQANASKRIQKIQLSSHALTWLHAGNHIHVHAWAKRGPKGKRKLWSPHITTLSTSLKGDITATTKKD